MKEILLGMDPGKDGFITAWDGKKFTHYSMPTHKVETGKFLKSGKPQMKDEFHISGLVDLQRQIYLDFKGCKLIVAIEEVGGRGGWSATNNFNFGHTAGMQRMIFEMLDAEIIMVRPQKWQSVVRRGYDLMKVKSSTGKTMVVDSKMMAEHIATTEYPGIDFKKTERSKNNHDGKMDSFLICLYLIRTYKPEAPIETNGDKNIRLGNSTII
tara:strand:- start:811 stop:1443 length:633 start_codon:yes stop_codon:yes gene_type:complete